MQLIYEQDLPLGVLARLVYDLPEAFLELAAVLRTGPQTREVEGEDPLAAQGLRNLLIDDPLGETLDDGGLCRRRGRR